MKNKSRVLTTVGVIAGFLALSACGGGPAADADTPEGRAFAYRDAVMTILANKLGTIGGMARGDIPVDEAVFVKATADLAATAGMLVEGFETEGIASGSRALPAIWEDFDDFQARANDLVQASQGLALAAAERGGFAAAQGLVQGTQGTCGACHRTYRAREE